jgi:hypothetical protein
VKNGSDMNLSALTVAGGRWLTILAAVGAGKSLTFDLESIARAGDTMPNHGMPPGIQQEV